MRERRPKRPFSRLSKKFDFSFFYRLTRAQAYDIILIMIIVINKENMNDTCKRDTKQKSIVYEVVAGCCDHPTAEVIYERTRKELPKVSLGTVYRILRGFVEEGKIRQRPMMNGPDRFDGNLKRHAHLVCKICGETKDVFEEELFSVPLPAKYGEADSEEIIFSGICAECVKNTNKE